MLLAVATELGLFAGLRLVRDAFSARSRGSERTPSSRLERLIDGLLVLSVAATAVAALVPVTDGDALCYHLQVPKVFLIRQAVFFDPDLHETVYPLVTEMLYALALEFRGPVACRCIQWVLGLVFAANVTALARPSLGRRAWWAGLVALLVPAVSNGMAAPLNDVALAAFGTAAIVAWTRLIDRPSITAALVAGAFCGLAIGVKYPALVLTGLLFGLPDIAALAGSGLAVAGRVGLLARPRGGIPRHGGARRRGLVSPGLRLHRQSRLTRSSATGSAGRGSTEVLAPIKRPLAVTFWNLTDRDGPTDARARTGLTASPTSSGRSSCSSCRPSSWSASRGGCSGWPSSVISSWCSA